MAACYNYALGFIQRRPGQPHYTEIPVMYRILVANDKLPEWHELGEGPWESPRAALRFAEAEVGVSWIVADGNNRPVAFGDLRGVRWSLLDRPHCSHRESIGKSFYVEVQYNNVREPDRFDWVDSGEGPFDAAEEAVEFAKSECGLPWRVVDEDFDDNGIEYDTGNEDQPPANPPACPACKTGNCEPGGGNWLCHDCGIKF